MALLLVAAALAAEEWTSVQVRSMA